MKKICSGKVDNNERQLDLKSYWTQLFEKDVFTRFNCRSFYCALFTLVLSLYAFYALVLAFQRFTW